jgi:4-azaleucine resistance transporter AzlC
MRALAFKQGWYCGTKESIAPSIAGGLFGLGFGLLAAGSGLKPYQGFLMSAFIYAGAAQVVALKTMAEPHFDVFALLISTIAISLRYGLMGFSISHNFKMASKKSLAFALFMLMDENWALSCIKSREKPDPAFLYGYFIGSGFLAYVCYLVCTLIGLNLSSFMLGSKISEIDFVFTALFIGLLIGSWRGKQEILPWAVSFILAILFKKILPGTWYIVSAALVASLAGAFYERCRQS